LHHATLCNRSGIVQELLRREANPNFCNQIGETPLHFAARSDNRSLVKLMLHYKASPFIKGSHGLASRVAPKGQTKEYLKKIERRQTIELRHKPKFESEETIVENCLWKEQTLPKLSISQPCTRVKTERCTTTPASVQTKIDFPIQKAVSIPIIQESEEPPSSYDALFKQNKELKRQLASTETKLHQTEMELKMAQQMLNKLQLQSRQKDEKIQQIKRTSTLADVKRQQDSPTL